MSTVSLIEYEHAEDSVKAVYDDIRKVRQTDFINNFWKALANNPEQLARTWDAVKTVMAPGAIDPLTKEMIYVAISATNQCSYCAHSHTAAAKAKGMTDEQHAELLAVIALANETNGLAAALQVEIDDRFLV
ncbi:MAG: carboxymuconolactone decarboxylase family protein [Pseudomonadota bacterium]